MAQYKGAASEAGRAMQLMKKREREREQLEQLKAKIAEVCFEILCESCGSIKTTFHIIRVTVDQYICGKQLLLTE